MDKKYLNIFILIALSLIWSCSDVADDPTEAPLDPDQGKSYFFLEEGKYREYDVYEIRYLAVDLSDTLSYEIREEVKEAVVNDQAEKAYLIYRYSRSNDQEEWALDSVWSARVERTRAVSTENNDQYVKMVFPADTIQSWDRNLFNRRDQKIARIKSFNKLFTVDFNTAFNNAMEVEISVEDDSIVQRDNRYEVFADSIGLVYKYYEVLKYCSREPECELGAKIIEWGRFYTETLRAHGFTDEED